MQVPLDSFGQHFLMTAFVSSYACNHITFANVLTVDTDAFPHMQEPRCHCYNLGTHCVLRSLLIYSFQHRGHGGGGAVQSHHTELLS